MLAVPVFGRGLAVLPPVRGRGAEEAMGEGKGGRDTFRWVRWASAEEEVVVVVFKELFEEEVREWRGTWRESFCWVRRASVEVVVVAFEELFEVVGHGEVLAEGEISEDFSEVVLGGS